MHRKVFCGLVAGAVGIGGLITFGLHWLDDSFEVCADVIMQEAPPPILASRPSSTVAVAVFSQQG